MSAQSILEQLFKSGMTMLEGEKSKPSSSSLPTSNQNDWGKYGTGAAVGGVLGLLLGSKRGRKMGGSALKYASVAALGVVAVKAYNNWKAEQAPANKSSDPIQAPSQSTPLLTAPMTELGSQAMLKAMIAAAKSDGHLDDREQDLIYAELDRQQASTQDRQWMQDEIRRPLDPAEIAAAATSPELAAQMYLASLLVADDTTYMERAYLDELARQLKLAPDQKQSLEIQAKAS